MRKGLRLVFGVLTATTMIVAVAGFMVFNFAWNTELIMWGLLTAGIAGGISFLSYCVYRATETDSSTPYSNPNDR